MFEQCDRKPPDSFDLFNVLFVFQSCGMMDCTHGRTRKRTRSVPSRRRSRLLFLISFHVDLHSRSSFISRHGVKIKVSCRFTCLPWPFIFTPLYCLHAAGSGYSWRLDRNKKGVSLEEDRNKGSWIKVLIRPFQVLFLLSGDGISGAAPGEGGRWEFLLILS